LRWVPEHARGGLLGQNPDLLPPVHTNSSKGFTLSVPLDHFATPPGPREFEDHYFIDDSCWDSANGPIFVEMGGEGGVGGARCGAQHRKHKAMAVSVEHRCVATEGYVCVVSSLHHDHCALPDITNYPPWLASVCRN
jgi:hypothetical protein